jgi:iron complex outermembrane receptor protein
MQNFRKTLMLSAGLGCYIAAATGVMAADATSTPSVGLEEIVVTAQKRSENLQTTPISITAVTGATLEATGQGTIAGLGQMTPNLVFNTTAPVSGASSGAVVFIRGVGQTDFQLTTDPGVGTYVDGVYESRSVGGVLDVLDLDRVEVLRGPQGTLFGRNTIGGAISLISREPSETFEGSATITAGSQHRLDGKLSLSGPLSDILRVGFVAVTKHEDGYVRGLSDNRDLGNVNRTAARLSLLFTPTATFKASLTVDGTGIREQNAADKLVGISITPPGAPSRTDIIYNRATGGVILQNVPVPPGNPSLAFLFNVVDAPALGLQPYDGRWITPSLGTTYATGPNGTSLDVWGTALTLDDKLPFDATLKSITSFRSTGGSFARDADGSPDAVVRTNDHDYEQRQFTQELQLTGEAIEHLLKYATGLYYFRETGHDILDVTLPFAFGQVRNYTFVTNDSYAAYAQATMAVTDKWDLTGGVRYTDDKKEYSVPVGGGAIVNGLLGIFGPPGTVTPFFPAGTFDRSFNNTSFKGGIDYKPWADTLLYLSYSEGFKSGGFNTRYLVPVSAVVSYNPELLTTYEAGIKWEGIDRRLRVNGSVFHSSYRDIQLTVYEQGAPITRNAGTARINGAELEISAIPIENLTLSSGVGYIDAKYTQVPVASAAVPLDQQITLNTKLEKTPKLGLNARAEYRIQVSLRGEVKLKADWMYSSKVENDAVNDKFLEQGAYQIANASIGYSVDHDRWNVSAFVDNLADKRIIESGDSNYSIGFHEANFNRPREYGITVGAKF